MSILKKIIERPTKEEKILNTKVQLEQLKDKYANLLEGQRRILKKNPTPREKELAEEKIRSGLCAYTICSQASRDLEEITSEIELNQTLKKLNRSLKVVNRFGRKSALASLTKKSLSKQAEKMKKREENVVPQEIFSDTTLGTVDEWLGSRWESVSSDFINGKDLKECVEEGRILLESDPVPIRDEDLFGQEDESLETDPAGDGLSDLLNSDIF